MMLHLDLSYIKKNVSEDETFILQLLDVFLEGLERDIPVLESAIQKKDHPSIRKAAHKVKSGFRSLGMANMTQYLQELEDMGKNGVDVEMIRTKFEGFMEMLPEVKQDIEDYKS